MIFCRNVLIYFDKALQDRVHALFYDSLAYLRRARAGQKESLKFSPHEDRYTALQSGTKLYRKTA